MTARPFLSAEWRHLALFNFLVDRAVVQPLAPAGTELDDWNGKTFLSVVGFMFLRTKLYGTPIPCHRDFEEVNLRFYVRRKAPEGWRRGVVFIQEFVPRLAVALVARRIYNENYSACRMGSTILPPSENDSTGSVEYRWKRKSSLNSMSVEFEGEPQHPSAGSEEEFIIEHYWGYTRQRDGGCLEYRVEHPPWRIWNATKFRFDCNVERCYGREFVDVLNRPPHSVFVADGSPVCVWRGETMQ